MSNTASAFDKNDTALKSMGITPYKDPMAKKIYKHKSTTPVVKKSVSKPKTKSKTVPLDLLKDTIDDTTKRKRIFSTFTPLSK